MHHGDTDCAGYGKFLLLSMVGSLLTAAVYVAVVYVCLPPYHEAYQRGLATVYTSPWVLKTAIAAAVLTGLAASPFIFLCLRHRRMWISLVLVLGAVVGAIVVGTPVSPAVGFVAGIAALIASCLLCMCAPFTRCGKARSSSNHAH